MYGCVIVLGDLILLHTQYGSSRCTGADDSDAVATAALLLL